MILLLINIIAFVLGGPNDTRIVDYLNSQFNGYNKIEYELLNDNILSKDFSIDTDRTFRINNNKCFIPVIIRINNSQKRTYLTLKIKLFKKVFIAVNDIPKGKKISISDFTTRLINVVKLRNRIVYDFKSYENFKTNRNISANSILVKESLKIPNTVEIGQTVNAQLIKGSVRVSFNAKARSSGIEGEFIRINGRNNQIFKAKIIDSKTVQIVEN